MSQLSCVVRRGCLSILQLSTPPSRRPGKNPAGPVREELEAEKLQFRTVTLAGKLTVLLAGSKLFFTEQFTDFIGKLPGLALATATLEIPGLAISGARF